MSTNHILHARYNHLLSHIRSVDGTSETLYEMGFISSGERAEVLAVLPEEGKRNALCNILTAKGASSLVKVSEVLSAEDQKQVDTGIEARKDFNAVTTLSSSSSSSSSSTGTTVSSGGYRDNFEGREEGGRWREEERAPVTVGLHQVEDHAKNSQGN